MINFIKAEEKETQGVLKLGLQALHPQIVLYIIY